MISRYRILFQTSFLHDYFAQGKCEEFDFCPSQATIGSLADSRLLFKVVGNKFLVLTKVDEADKPAAAIPSDKKFVFYLDLKGTEFLIVTNVDASTLRGRRLYFSNLNQNLAGLPPSQVLNLTKAIEVFAPARNYRPGELAQVGTTVFECIQAGQGQAPDAPSSAFWISRGAVQYSSSQDVIPLLPQIANFTLLAAANAFRVKVFGLDTVTNVYDSLVRDEVVTASALETTREVQVNLAALQPGRYRLDINGEVFEAYFDDEAVARGIFGVVEVFLHLPDTNPFSLLNSSGVVRETPYTVRFANRRAFWKYITPLRKVENILINGDHNQPSPFTPGSNDPAQPTQKDFFVSKQPLPLSEVAAQNLFDLIIGSETRPAPKPDPSIPGMLTQTFDGATQTYLDHICNIRLNH
jgi:hypothetical protein